MLDLTCLAFDLSDKYRNPAMILGDALIGQMKEPLLRRTHAKAGPSPERVGPDRSDREKTQPA